MYGNINDYASPAALFSTYASMAASLMFFRSLINEFIPQYVIDYVISLFDRFFKSHTASDLSIIFEEGPYYADNELYDAAELYLSTKISPKTDKLKISKRFEDQNMTFHLKEGETVVDTFHGADMKWKLVGRDKNDSESKKHFELCFAKEQRNLVLDSYITFVLAQNKTIKDSARELRMHTLSSEYDTTRWDSVVLHHPSTLETVAMPEDQKRSVIEDLDRFVKRREFYKKVGRAWKRGYLLYGPPGTGKSSLVAAMANYLKFDIYDLQLALVKSDSDLRRLLLAAENKSIIVIEDIDCSVNLPDRIGDNSGDTTHETTNTQLTLSGILNFIDGLWSSCGDERIIVFTTNHKEKLDPALLRPGRMDVHIHMSYCTFHAFKVLASNYLGVSDHRLYKEIEDLFNSVQVTPAQVAEEFMCEDVDLALEGLLKLLKEKKMEAD